MIIHGISPNKGYIVEHLTERFIKHQNESTLETLLDYLTYIVNDVEEEHKPYWFDKMDFYSKLLIEREKHQQYLRF